MGHQCDQVAPIPEDSTTESCVLVIYTGGTIGMKPDEVRGFVPAANSLGHFIHCCPSLHDKEFAEKRFGKKALEPNSETPYVLPSIHGVKRIFYYLKEYPELLDSSNMTSKEWTQIASDIKKYYDNYFGFVILHGTDTMTYTASALSFMFENLGKSVVLTGAQLSIYDPRSDAKNNFLESLIIAGNYVIPEVTICFGRKLLRGNRSTKIDSEGFDAFDSPSFSPLASLGAKIQVNNQEIFWPQITEKFKIHTKLNQNMALLHLFPGICLQTLKSFLQPPLEGVVLLTYGSGNMPSNQQKLLDELKKAIDRGVLIVNCSQCNRGSVSDIYETGKVLSKIGAIAGMDMTPEAAATKLSYVLGRDDWSTDMKKKMMKNNLRGELTAIDQKLMLTNIAQMDISLLWKCMTNQMTLCDVLLPALMCFAVSFNDRNRIEEILSYGGDISKPNVDGRTPLHIACSKGNVAMAEYLLAKKANINVKDRHDNTPLNEAIRYNNHRIIELLVSKGGTLHFSMKFLGEKLCRAAARGDIKKLKSYKMAGVKLSQEDTAGRTSLHMAALHGHIECTKFLIDEGCPKDKKDELGLSPKDYAQRSQTETFQMFLDIS